MNTQRLHKKMLQTIHMSLAILWIYQGLIPKILFQADDERRIWMLQGFNEHTALSLMQYSGAIEIIFGALFLTGYKTLALHYLNIVGMLGLSFLILLVDPHYFTQAFNPFVMNIAMMALSLTAIRLLKYPERNA
ncbi:DoxX-like family protein [Acinetobacter sp. AM]|uniref:DoxX-like family protein n=1 Tax=Acinetobacter sp. AM TaxID=2170730 RepID=UPI001D178233|nr:DoxX-like family protein [Acinetobacter sp. AM]